MEDSNFKKLESYKHKSDFLIIGSGLAGLYASLYASKFGDVTLLTKSTIEQSNTYWAQGGIAAAVDPEDSPVFHREDTVKAGRGLCDEEAAEILVSEGRDRVLDLIGLGMKFDSGKKGFDLSLEGGHTKRRVLHSGGSSTGKGIVEFLITSVKKKPRIKVLENTTVIDLISDGKSCYGATAYGKPPMSKMFLLSRSTILATGGAAGLYLNTTNPPGAIGQGISVAFRSGAEISDLEFVQFHPTALYTKNGLSFLITEAIRGEGAHLLNHSGERFMIKYHELGELAPRDVVSMAIFKEMKTTGKNFVFLALNQLDPIVIKKRFSNIYNFCLKNGIDITNDPIPVAPAAHYTIGGVKTGLMGETNVNGLFACGEVACTGVHGANRLASNSLLECIVFAKRAVDGARECDNDNIMDNEMSNHKNVDRLDSSSAQNDILIKINNALSTLMTKCVGIVRSEEGLKISIEELDKLSELTNELHGYNKLMIQNMIDLCSLIANAALLRQETRGVHTRDDFPYEDPKFKAHIVWKRGFEPTVTNCK